MNVLKKKVMIFNVISAHHVHESALCWERGVVCVSGHVIARRGADPEMQSAPNHLWRPQSAVQTEVQSFPPL